MWGEESKREMKCQRMGGRGHSRAIWQSVKWAKGFIYIVIFNFITSKDGAALKLVFLLFSDGVTARSFQSRWLFLFVSSQKKWLFLSNCLGHSVTLSLLHSTSFSMLCQNAARYLWSADVQTSLLNCSATDVIFVQYTAYVQQYLN